MSTIRRTPNPYRPAGHVRRLTETVEILCEHLDREAEVLPPELAAQARRVAMTARAIVGLSCTALEEEGVAS